jgi:D-aminopeptidase
MNRGRIRDFGIIIGELEPGKYNAITDVSGVRVGQTTVISGNGKLVPGVGPVRTGVTVILPHGRNLFHEKVVAAVHTINGYGKAVGFEQIRELGEIEAPIALTNTLNVGLVMDALVEYSIHQNPEIGITESTVNVVVGETNDGFLNDIQGRHVLTDHVMNAINNATAGQVQEGSCGAGMGTRCFGWKGGIGTSSRVIPETAGGYTLGALVQTNFGSSKDLIINGIPVGKSLQASPNVKVNEAAGSIMIVIACDASLTSSDLERICRRATVGISRVGGRLSHGSGDFVIGFCVNKKLPIRLAENPINYLFQAAIESVEEAIINSLTCAETVTGRDGNTIQAIPIDQLITILKSDD